MILIGILVTLLGFVISVLSLALNSVGARMVIVLLGLAVSLFGIIGVLNKAYLENAIWKKGCGEDEYDDEETADVPACGALFGAGGFCSGARCRPGSRSCRGCSGDPRSQAPHPCGRGERASAHCGCACQG